MGFFQKYFKHHIQQRISLKWKFASLQISYNKKSRKIGNKMSKLLNNVVCKKQVESSSIEMEQYFSCLSSETDDDSTPTYVCEICFEPRHLDVSFNIKGCAHFYCIECTIMYIESKLDDNVTRIPCPVKLSRAFGA